MCVGDRGLASVRAGDSSPGWSLPTSSLPDVQDVANDFLGVGQRLTPRHSNLSGGHRDGLDIAWRAWQPLSPQHGQPGTGL